jgi:hypothetical protein
MSSNFDKLLSDAVQTGSIVKDYQLGHQKFKPICPVPKPKDKNQLIVIAHPLWCNRYYICDHGIPIERRCHKGTIWNAKRKHCEISRDHPTHCVMANFGLNKNDNFESENDMSSFLLVKK